MAEKRFKIVHLRDIDICDVQDTLQDIPTFYNDLGRIESVKPVVDLLNELHDENEQLKQLAGGNEEQLLKVMTYLHDKYYEVWEEVNKECFKGDD